MLPEQSVRHEISIHALREEGDLCHLTRFAGRTISIHALREEGDVYPYEWSCTTHLFLSTPSARRATVQIDRDEVARVISIHALREEGDHARNAHARTCIYFYPRPPRGGRPRASFSSSF